MKKILKIIGIIIGVIIMGIILLNIVTISWGFYQINQQKNNIPQTKASVNYYKNHIVISKFDSTNESIVLPVEKTLTFLITTEISSQEGKPIKFLIVKKDSELLSKDCLGLISRCFLTSEVDFTSDLNFSFNFDNKSYKVNIPQEKILEIKDTTNMLNDTESFLNSAE
jgi:hypothetical protein